MASKGIKIAVVGGGLAGLAASMKIAEAGHDVDLFGCSGKTFTFCLRPGRNQWCGKYQR